MAWCSCARCGSSVWVRASIKGALQLGLAQVQQKATSKLAHVHEQSEFTYGAYLVARITLSLHVEYAERGQECDIRFICSLFCEYSHLEYVRIHVIYRLNQGEYVIHTLVVAPHEYVNTYSTRRRVSIQCALSWECNAILHVGYAERRLTYGILFIFSAFYEYINLEYGRVHVICRMNQAEYGIHILLAASQEYVNNYSTRRNAIQSVVISFGVG